MHNALPRNSAGVDVVPTVLNTVLFFKCLVLDQAALDFGESTTREELQLTPLIFVELWSALERFLGRRCELDVVGSHGRHGKHDGLGVHHLYWGLSMRRWLHSECR